MINIIGSAFVQVFLVKIHENLMAFYLFDAFYLGLLNLDYYQGSGSGSGQLGQALPHSWVG